MADSIDPADQSERARALTPPLLAAILRGGDTLEGDSLILYEEMLGWQLSDFSIDVGSVEAGELMARRFRDMGIVFSASMSTSAQIIARLAEEAGVDPFEQLASWGRFTG